MANGQINRLLEFANLQMGAEAFLARSGDLSPNHPLNEDILDRLIEGNTHNSRFTSAQAEQFTAQYEVLTQYRNDPLLGGGSGFSGTLFRNRATGELTLSFRSTEFIDDAVRDNKATNELEIKNIGWAFGQIAEMEAWYAQLRADPNLLGGHSFNVTGYSLGGHLATAFNILRREEYAAAPEFNPVLETYTFNGAGTGAILDGRRLSDLLADFNRIRADYVSSPEWAVLSSGDQATVIALAQERIDEINSERFRIGGLTGVSWAFAAPAPSGSQILLGYQIAAILVGQYTIGASNFPLVGGVNDIPSSPIFVSPALRIPGMTEVVGMETEGLATSFVSNSGMHYGVRQEVPIEAQPTFRGSWSVADLVLRNLLIDNPGENDFGDTHSLALLVDSLSLMAAMENLDPEFTPELGMEIFAAASSARASQSLGSQGTAEGDTLERMLDALYKLVYGSAPEAELDYESVLAGNTWHLNEHRAPFHDRLMELNAAIEEVTANPGAPSYSFVSLADYSSEEIAFLALRDDAVGKAYRYALRELNSFVVIADDDFYTPHNIHGELELYSDCATTGSLSDEWIADRAAMLAWRNLDAIENGERVLRSANLQSHVYEQRDASSEADLGFLVVGTAASSGNTSAATNPVRITFGSLTADEIAGGMLGDRLYGEGGDDTLLGGQGNDYLEGGTGNDTYVWNSGDGFDTIRDTDGTGQIVINGEAIVGGIQVALNDYISTGGQFVLHFEGDPAAGGLLTINGDLRIENFTDGDLGITLGLEGGLDDIQPATTTFTRPFSWNTPGIGFGTDGADAVIDTDSFFVAKGGDDFLQVSGDGDAEFYAGAGEDVIVGEGVSLFGTPHVLVGDAGADIILGGNGGENISGDFNYLYYGADYFSFATFRFGGYAPEGEPYGEGYWLWNSDFLEVETSNDVFEPLSASYSDAFRYVLGIEDGADLGSLYDDYVDGGGGSDTIYGGNGSDVVYGGAGNDVIVGDEFIAIPQAGTQMLPWMESALSLLGSPGDDYIDGGAGDDILRDSPFNNRSFGGNDILIGGEGNDTLENVDTSSGFSNSLHGDTGNDILISINPLVGGRDYLFGGDGDDVMKAEAYEGYLAGGDGSDHYQLTAFFFLPQNITIRDEDFDGNDFNRITITAPFSTQFDIGVALQFGRNESDLLIDFDWTIESGGASFAAANSYRVEDWFEGAQYKIDEVVLDDPGTPGLDYVYDIETIESRLMTATASNDSLWGTSLGDQISGGAGDDTLSGGVGDDILTGNEGDDDLDGGGGTDLYVFNVGDGADRIDDTGQAGSDGISFGQGVTKDQLNWNPSALTLSIGPSGDLIRLGSTEAEPDVANPGGIEYLQFTDGTMMFFRQLTDPTFVPPALDSGRPVWVPGIGGTETIPGAGGGTGGSPDGGGGSGVPGGGAGDGSGANGNNGGDPGQPDTGGGTPGDTGGSGGNGSGDPDQPDIGGGIPGDTGGEPTPTGPDGTGGVGGTPASTVLAVRGRIEGDTTGDFPAFDNLPGGNSRAFAGAVRQEGRATTDLIDSYFDDDPRSGLDVFVRYASPGSGRAEAMSPQEIARRWKLIAQYLDELGELTDEDARGGAGEWHPIDVIGLASNGGTAGQVFGHAGSTGATRGFGSLKTFQGLSEGFARIPMQS